MSIYKNCFVWGHAGRNSRWQVEGLLPLAWGHSAEDRVDASTKRDVRGTMSTPGEYLRYPDICMRSGVPRGPRARSAMPPFAAPAGHRATVLTAASPQQRHQHKSQGERNSQASETTSNMMHSDDEGTLARSSCRRHVVSLRPHERPPRWLSHAARSTPRSRP